MKKIKMKKKKKKLRKIKKKINIFILFGIFS